MSKLIAAAFIIALTGFVLISFLGLGLSENGAMGLALGLFLGIIFGKKLPLDKFSLPKPSKKPQSDQSVYENSDGTLSIFVGNLAYKARGRQLAALFEPFGEIHSIRIVKDRETGKAKGFGFVEMNAADAYQAISDLDGSEFFGRVIKVSAANSQKSE